MTLERDLPDAPDPPLERLPHLVALILLGLFLWAGSVRLGSWPVGHDDEAWLSSPGYHFVTEGRFRSELFRGYLGNERHTYTFMPLFPILDGAALRIGGIGLAAARVVPLLTGALILLLTYGLGRRLISPWGGVFAMTLLASWPIAAGVSRFPFGIPLFDLARHARNDTLVALFGLAALLLASGSLMKGSPVSTNETTRRPDRRRWLAVGALCGLATLGHVYGAFWLLAIAVAASTIVGRAAWRGLWLAGLAFALVLVPWLLFVADGWRDFVLQQRGYGERFTVTDLGFYVKNLVREPERYRFLLGAARRGRPEALAWLVLVIAGLGVTLFAARRSEGAGKSPAARLLLAPIGAGVGLFALLLSPKNVSYLAPLWPLFALLSASALAAAWRALRVGGAGQSGLRALLGLRLTLAIAMVGLVVAFTVHGGVIVVGQLRRAGTVTPHRQLFDALTADLSPSCRLVGPTHAWYALAGRFPRYRSVAAALLASDRRYADPPRSLAEMLSENDVLLLDQTLLDWLDLGRQPSADNHQATQPLRDLIARAGGPSRVHLDPTYGRLARVRLRACPKDR